MAKSYRYGVVKDANRYRDPNYIGEINSQHYRFEWKLKCVRGLYITYYFLLKIQFYYCHTPCCSFFYATLVGV